MVHPNFTRILGLHETPHEKRLGFVFMRKGKYMAVPLEYGGDTVTPEKAVDIFFQLWIVSGENRNLAPHDQRLLFGESLCDAMVCWKIRILQKTRLTHESRLLRGS